MMPYPTGHRYLDLLLSINPDFDIRALMIISALHNNLDRYDL